MKRLAIVAGLILAIVSITDTQASWKETPGMYAVIETNHGTIVAELYPDKAPKTVENFAGLALAPASGRNPSGILKTPEIRRWRRVSVFSDSAASCP